MADQNTAREGGPDDDGPSVCVPFWAVVDPERPRYIGVVGIYTSFEAAQRAGEEFQKEHPGYMFWHTHRFTLDRTEPEMIG